MGGLNDEDARDVLGLAIVGRVDERVVDRIVAETRGNPLALLELPRELSAAELAGGFGVSSTQPLSARLEGSFLGRVRSMPSRRSASCSWPRPSRRVTRALIGRRSWSGWASTRPRRRRRSA